MSVQTGSIPEGSISSKNANQTSYPDPQGGASLLLAFRPVQRTFLVIGTNRLAAVRVLAALEANSDVVVASSQPLHTACDELQWRINHQQARFIQLSDTSGPSIAQLLDMLPETSLVCVTDTLLVDAANRRSAASAGIIRDICRARHIAINITDMPALCDFTFPSTHRFSASSTGTTADAASRPSSPLQIAITTNGQGCRIAGRIRREISTKLHPKLGDAVANIARLRAIAKDQASETSARDGKGGDREDDEGASTPLNSPVPQLGVNASVVDEDPIDRTVRRMRWVNQISEHWPIERLAALQEEEMQGMLDPKETSPADIVTTSSGSSGLILKIPLPDHLADGLDQQALFDTSRHSLLSGPNLSPVPPKGQILLVGSGPGHPSMLTVAARKALTELGTRVLSDKLVPSEVLALIPPHVPLYIAKKYPGNSEGAQNELMEMAVEGALKGETVVRLKQGDPMLYGRGGEEVLYFRSHGFEPLVLPGVSSALAAPTFAGIPVTQRGAAESLMICTGVGRKGKSVTLPPYERSRTVVILMGVARLSSLLTELRTHAGGAYPPYLPIAIVERASSPDQRLIAGTLETIERILEGPDVGEQRTPGMIVVGWVVLALEGKGDLEVLDDACIPGRGEDELEVLDQARISRWLGPRTSIVRDGLAREWEQFL